MPLIKLLLRWSTLDNNGWRTYDIAGLLIEFDPSFVYMIDSELYNHEGTQMWWTWPTFFDGPAPSYVPGWWLDKGPRDVSILMAETVSPCG